MGRSRIKIHTGQRIQQNQELRAVVLLGSCCILILVGLTSFFTLNVHHARAKGIDIRQAEEQTFSTDITLAEPTITNIKKAEAHTIFIQRIKQLQPKAH